MIRRAEEKDIERINALLYQVCNVHAEGRPDIFIRGGKKYTDDELKVILKDDSRPVFVYSDEDGIVQGYAFCIYETGGHANAQYPRKVLYIDDICVDESMRRKGIASALYEYVLETAKESECDSVTLNVWKTNKGAQAFYESRGMQPLKTMMEQRLK